MKIIILKYNFSHFESFNNPDEWSFFRWPENNQVIYVSRAPETRVIHQDEYDYYLFKDKLPAVLHWWQKAHHFDKYVSQLKPDIVHIAGLNLPLHFRFLKRQLQDNVKIFGEYQNDRLWNQKMLWLQQRSMRVVDGFIFPDKFTIQPWLKCAAILPRQDIVYLKEAA